MAAAMVMVVVVVPMVAIASLGLAVAHVGASSARCALRRCRRLRRVLELVLELG